MNKFSWFSSFLQTFIFKLRNNWVGRWTRNYSWKVLNYGLGTFLFLVFFLQKNVIFAGFDDFGRQYDRLGSVRNWWQEDTSKEFTTRAKCFRDKVKIYKEKCMQVQF